MVVNLPPLGCIPALLTLYGGPDAEYDEFGCLKKLNKITAAHNVLLGEKVAALRTKYPAATLLYADAEAVYYDILKSPATYSKNLFPDESEAESSDVNFKHCQSPRSHMYVPGVRSVGGGTMDGIVNGIVVECIIADVTAPLKACCGVGGDYNFNAGVTCGHAGLVDGKFVNLTMTLPLKPCENPAGHLSWDGIHTSNTFNKAAATAFLLGKHITPAGGLNCAPDFTFWDARS